MAADSAARKVGGRADLTAAAKEPSKAGWRDVSKVDL